MRGDKLRAFLENLLDLLDKNDVQQARNEISKQIRRIARKKRCVSLSPSSKRFGAGQGPLLSPRKIQNDHKRDSSDPTVIILPSNDEETPQITLISPRSVSFEEPANAVPHHTSSPCSKLERIVEELIETENSYVLDLKTIVEVCMNACQVKLIYE